MSEQHAPVVVGIDGSEDALPAVAWAAEEAERRHAPLQVVYTNMWPLIRGHWPADVADQLLEYSKLLVREAVNQARKTASADITGTGTVPLGRPGGQPRDR